MDNDSLSDLQLKMTDLNISMGDVRDKQILINNKLDNIDIELKSMDKRQRFFQKHSVLIIGLSTLLVLTLIFICNFMK